MSSSQKYIQENWKGKCLDVLTICIKKKSTGHEELWKDSVQVFAYKVPAVLNVKHWPIRNQVVTAFNSGCVLLYELCSSRININNTHLCDLAVHLLKKKLCRTVQFSYTEHAFWKECSVMSKSPACVNYLICMFIHLIGCWLWNLGYCTYSNILASNQSGLCCISLAFNHKAHSASASVITDNAVSQQGQQRYFSEFPVTQMGCHFTRFYHKK